MKYNKELVRYGLSYNGGLSWNIGEDPNGEYVRYDQAAAEIAAKDFTISELSRIIENLNEAVGDNAALTARVEGLETVALFNEAKELAFTAISRMRAAHIPCLDLTMQAEKLVGNIDTATRTRSQAEGLDRFDPTGEDVNDHEGDFAGVRVVMRKFEAGVYVRFDQVEAIIAAKDAEIGRLRELFKTQSEGHAEHVKGMIKTHEREREIYGQAAQDFRERAEKAEADNAALTARVKELETEVGSTGCIDKDGNTLFVGDRVRYRIEGSHTKAEYWNPEYEIIFRAPCFTLQHVGGGKDGGSNDFILRCGGRNGDLELISRGDYGGNNRQSLETQLAAAKKALEAIEDHAARCSTLSTHSATAMAYLKDIQQEARAALEAQP